MSTNRSGRRWGCILMIPVGVVVMVLLFIYGVIPFFESGGGNADTRPVPGDASRFDPLTALPDVRAYAGPNAQLISLEASYVRSDGTMDLTASYRPAPETTYDFVYEMASPPPDAPPIGAGGAVNGKWYQPVEVTAYQPGEWRHVMSSHADYDYMNKGMERELSSPTASPDTFAPDPTCTFKQLWDVALKNDAPPSAVAVIKYNSDGYSFEINGTSVDLEFDTNCQLKTN